ncbi:MAG: peptide deformylase [Gemmatimonadota bacterium]
MSIRPIRILGDPVLRESAALVESFDEALAELVEDMWETMYHADGIGLAAPQIGVSQRIFVIDVRRSDEDGPEPLALINPTVVDSSKKTEKAPEGCLSIPGMEDVVTRPIAVRVEALDLSGAPLVLEADGLFARALQHEIDHLDGVLFIDRLSPLKRRLLLERWKKAQADEE